MSARRGAELHLDRFDAVLFDLDGVLTDTAALHQAAWTAVFAELFAQSVTSAGASPSPFTNEDYRRLVDGEARLDGVRHVLADRTIPIPEGSSNDPSGLQSVHAIAARKDEGFAALLASEGPHPFPGSVDLLRRLRSHGVATAVVSASRHCAEVLAVAGLDRLVDVVVDGLVGEAMALSSKPDPASYLEAAIRLGADPDRTVVVEDALAGVDAGRRGGFGLVVGVARRDSGAELMAAGADLVVSDLADLELKGTGPLSDGWHLTYQLVRDGEEGVRETLCTLGNGYLASRGTRLESRDDGHYYPGTYLAGLYNRLTSTIGSASVEHESIVNAPNFLPLTISANGGPFLGEPGTAVTEEQLRLDLRSGVLARCYRITDDVGRRTRVLERRIVSMAAYHLAAIELQVVAENWSGTLCIRSGIDAAGCADQTTESRLLSHCHLALAGSGEDPPNLIWLAARTTQSDVLVAAAARTTISGESDPRTLRAERAHIEHECVVSLAEGVRCQLEKVVAVYTSKDRAISEPISAARQCATEAPGFAELLAEHRAAWARLWTQAALDVTVADRTRPLVNLHLFHLLQVASPSTTELDAGLGARGLHGEGYEGHVFWDELFVFPVLNVRFPAISRTFLRYRHRRLGAARRLAAQAGESGARFPWQSGSDGRDETPIMLFNPRSGRWMADHSANQRHVGLAVAYNCWRYLEATGDDEFRDEVAAEIIFEVARHFACLASFDEALGHYRIRGVMGPDEFHDGYPDTEETGIDDNAYTNVLASWTLARATELAETLTRERRTGLLGRLRIGEAELARFDEVARGLYVPFHDAVISQFAGYEALKPIDLDAYRARYGNIGRLDLILEAEGDAVRRYQVAKQADTVMLFYLFSLTELREVFSGLGYELSDECVRQTIDYYGARVTHGSTLSRVIYAWVAARADRRTSWPHLAEALAADMADTQGGSTKEGVHLGAMAGTVDVLQRCYTGLETRDGALNFDPVLPDELKSLRLTLAYRGHQLDVVVDHREITVAATPGGAPPVTLVLAGRTLTLPPGGQVRRHLPRDPAKRAASSVGADATGSRSRSAGGLAAGRHLSNTNTTNRRNPRAMTTDPVCGMSIEESAAAGSITHEGTVYYFCSITCQERFEAEPSQYASEQRQ